MSVAQYAKVRGSDGFWYLSCEEVHAFLDDYFAGALPAERRAEFERHLARCPSCTAYLASYRATVELARAALDAADEPPPPELVAAILAARS